MGRPSEYTPEVGITLCVQLVEGKSLRSICRQEGMPGLSTVFQWLAAHPEFAEQYARAREAQADTLADEITDIADTPLVGQVKKTTADGVEITEEDMLGHRRLQIDARKWIASKLKPKKYGEKIDHEHTGKGGGPIVISSTDAEL
jgi:hypothetical protein